MKHWKARARQLRQEVTTVYIAARDPRTPLYAKVLAVGIVAYALSPLDLVPDPIPVLGYLDDLILLPLAILLVMRLIPEEVVVDARRRAADAPLLTGLIGKIGIVMILILWILSIVALICLGARWI